MLNRVQLASTIGCLVALALLLSAMLACYPHGGIGPLASVSAKPARRGDRAPPIPPPPIEPLAIRTDLTPDDARAVNAAVPFVPGEVVPAAPFKLDAPPDERERALTCLASAAWYEAGDDPEGQRAVVQVVLNRLRHPVYPKSVCAVVFEGSTRTTGCQFTFTCDGALARTPSAMAWQRARAVAGAALNGAVFRPVGTATHYHTDWVVPYWSATLDKIAAVHTHLFFRWRGWWGSPAALTGRYAGPEALDPRLARLSDQAVAPIETAGTEAGDQPPTPAPRPALTIPGMTEQQFGGNILRLADPIKGEYVLELSAAAYPGSYAVVSTALCKNRPHCIVMGWSRPERLPVSLPVPMAALRSVSFLFRRERQSDPDAIHWNCQQFARANPAQCLPGTEPLPPPTPPRDAAALSGTSPD